MVVLRAVSILARTRPFVVVRAAPAVLPRVHLTPVPARTLTTSVSVQGKNRSNEPSAKQKRRGKGEPDLSELDHDEAGDVPVIDKKTGEIKGQVGDDKRNGEKFDEDQTKIRFKKVLDAAESHLSELMVRVKRPDPKIIEKLPAQLHHNKDDTTYKIKELASVGVDGDSYVIHCFDKNYLKPVEKAIYDSKLDLVPNQKPEDEEGVIRIPVPKPTNDSRNALIKEIATVMEYYRRGARDVRKVAQKLVKSDTNNGVVSTNEASSEGSAVDYQVKQVTQAINKLQSDAQEALRKMQASEDI